MSATVTVTFNNLSPSEAQNLFASLRCDYNGPAPVVHPAQLVAHAKELAAARETEMSALADAVPADLDAPAKKRGRPPKAKPAETPAAEAPQGKPPTLNDARTALAELMSKQGMDGCREILAKFGINRIGELDAAKYAEFIKACAA